MEIFELEFSADDFTTLYLPNKGQEQLFKGEIENRIIDCQSVKDVWQNFIALPEEVKKEADFFEIEASSAIILSSKAASVFSQISDPAYIDFLPMASDEQTYYLLNLKSHTKDAVNFEHSELESLPSNIIISSEKLVFNSEQLRNKLIFVISELPYRVFVTDLFQKLYVENDLTEAVSKVF